MIGRKNGPNKNNEADFSLRDLFGDNCWISASDPENN
jgi:hypothetical protein